MLLYTLIILSVLIRIVDSYDDVKTISETQWPDKLMPSETLTWMEQIQWSNQINTRNIKETFYEFAGLWNELQAEKIKGIQNKLGISSITTQARNSWSDVLRFIEAGQKDVVLRVLERRLPQQEISILPGNLYCDQGSHCNPKIDITVWFTPREHRGTIAELGVATTFDSKETGTHHVITQLIKQDSLPLSIVTSSYNPSNTQKHEHSRTIILRENNQPTVMMYRWSIKFVNSGKTFDMIKWYVKSSAPSHPGRIKVFPLPDGFMTQTSNLLAFKVQSKTDNSGFMHASTTKIPTQARVQNADNNLMITDNEATTPTPTTASSSSTTEISIQPSQSDTTATTTTTTTSTTTIVDFRPPNGVSNTYVINQHPYHNHEVHPLTRINHIPLSRTIHQRVMRRPHRADTLHQRLKRKSEAHVERLLDKIHQRNRGNTADYHTHAQYSYEL